MPKKITTVILTGAPSIGKTTIVQKLIQIIKRNHLKCTGFYTEEIRFENGSKFGYDVVSIDGKRGVLARRYPNDKIERPQVGKYFVYVDSFEQVALPSLKVATKNVLIIDEIGKMELLSKKFKKTIGQLLGKTSILATVPVRRNQSISVLERMKTDPNTVVLEITKKNRNQIVYHIFERVTQMIWE